ncbi:unnamed protein product, partial [Meganyctiphanes norvegica]
MFSKAKVKRFNEEVNSTPAPNQYDSAVKERSISVSLDKSDRWNKHKEVIPGPGAYNTVRTMNSVTPTKRRPDRSKSSISLHNSSMSSTTSDIVFISPPPKPISRSKSTRSLRGRPGDKMTELEDRISTITKERDEHKEQITNLEAQLLSLRQQLNERSPLKCTHEGTDYLKSQLANKEQELKTIQNTVEELAETNDNLQAQLDGNAPREQKDDTVILEQQLIDTQKQLSYAQQLISTLQIEQSSLQMRIQTLDDPNIDLAMKDQLDHLTLLRDNLEASVMCKEELIAELQLQFDDIVAESRNYQEDAINYKSKIDQIEKVVSKEERIAELLQFDDIVELLGRCYQLQTSLISEKNIYFDLILAIWVKRYRVKVIRIIYYNLNISGYKNTIEGLNNKTISHLEKIESLEATISDISIITKEKEMIESMMEEEINHRTEEVSKLEITLHEMEKKIIEAERDKESMNTTVAEEQKLTDQLNKRIEKLELQLKEKEVLQQFLEKEIGSRETEVTASAGRIRDLETHLETARYVALDLQQEAEMQINQPQYLRVGARMASAECTRGISPNILLRLDIVYNETSKTFKIHILELNSRQDFRIPTYALLFKLETPYFMEKNHIKQAFKKNDSVLFKLLKILLLISSEKIQVRYVVNFEKIICELSIRYFARLLQKVHGKYEVNQGNNELEREKLLHMASDGDVGALKLELEKLSLEHCSMEANLKDLVQKYTNCEDALACEEASYRELEERLTLEMKSAREYKAKVEKEISTLKTSGDGYCTQITQLKIDMRKKGVAVEEMQVCIEALREEKNHLEMLKNNLEQTLAQKEEMVSKLHLQASEFEREKEEERITARTKIDELKNSLKTVTDEQSSQKIKVQELEDQLSAVEDDKLNQHKHYEQELESKNLEMSRLKAELEDVQGQYDGYDDKLNSLQLSVMDKTAEVSTLQAEMLAVTRRADLAREEADSLQSSVARVRGEIEALNKSIASKDTQVNNLNDTLDTKSQEVSKLYKNLEEQQSMLLKSEKRLQETEDNEEKLVKAKDAAVSRAVKLEEALNDTKEQLSRLEITFSEERAVEMSRVVAPLESELDELRERNIALSEEVTHWKDKFNHLEKMIEPFREQLDAYEVEKQSLLSRSDEAKVEVDKLSKQYASLLGHQNHKQKIQHVLKLKTENNQLREDVTKLRQETERQRKSVRRLEDKLEKITGSRSRLNETARLNESSRFSDKENLSILMPSNSQPLGSSTPIKHKNKPARI